MRNKTKAKSKSTSTSSQPVDEAKIFKLKGINMEIPRGQLVAIVGAVGVGKTSLLQGIIGEMRRVAGTVEFGGTVAYCAQTAWIQNATIRENICFGRLFEEERYWKAVHDSCLEPDLQILPNYDLTEVGEKGISLSGGQKQRINICRAIYCNSDIMIFDDPLSALDAHVGKAVFTNVLKNSTVGKTRILVTHALHFLPEVDYIYTLADGKIAERGTFNVLMANDGAFCKFIQEFGSKEDNSKNNGEYIETSHEDTKEREVAVKSKPMMQEDERNTGAIPWRVYREYLVSGNGVVLVPILFLSLALMQVSNVMSSYWLIYWEELKWDYPEGFYMGIYAALGVSQSLTMFCMGASFAMLTYYASQELHERAITRVLHAPMSFFETTPLGRIMNRFAKDIDTIDNSIGDSLRMMSATASNILGAIILISIILPWFLLVVFFVLACYFYIAFFYRASARELKRLDAILRGSLYAHFSESLSGLSTISAYGESVRFKNENVELVDVENRAYWMTITNQRWLGIRLDFLGAILTFAVAILTIGTRFSISPGQTGVVLSYILMVQQSFGWMVRQIAEVENNMNSVERIAHYANEVEQEAPHQLKNSVVSPSWPVEGCIAMKDVFMKYRPELPPVLKGLSMTITPGEKIGIVGRTGAGKSSIMTALYRLVELSSGSIEIDGVDISKVGLEQLRKGLAIIPQDAFLFSGTLRSNLDPFGLHDDARLWDTLRRAHLMDTHEKQPSSPETTTQGDTQVVGNRFDLDTLIDDEGSNLSVGQRSLVSLARALVHETKILILDEATASVDYETDGKIQDTIATEFKERTILCIAHRLRTIISYDRICVLDAGMIAEFDTPANLFDISGGIFRGIHAAEESLPQVKTQYVVFPDLVVMSDQQKEIGTLVVVVLKAQHLHQPSFYKQNPYAQATLSGQTKRTKVDPKGGQHPVWDEEFRFPILADVGKEKANRILEVACYKDEQRGDDVLLGKGTVDIEETLKTGEFDDWVSLETSAGARGEIYLEMTFYANSPPSITRRPSKFNPSDRVARPAAYFNQGRQSVPKSTSPNTSPRPGRFPVTGDRKPVQQSQTGGTQLAASLSPTHGPQSQPSRQASPTSGTSPVATKTQRDDPLPPLPDEDAPPDAQVGSRKKQGLPAALQPGGGGPRSMPPHSRNRVASTSHLPPEMVPSQPSRMSGSDTSFVNAAVPSPSLPLQSSMQYYTSGATSMTSTTPSIVVQESIEDHPRVVFPMPYSPPPGLTQEHESRGIYAAGIHDSFTYGFPGQVYAPPNSHAYTSATTQAYPQVPSLSPHPAPTQPTRALPGQPQQHHDSSPASPYQPYTQYPNGPSTPFSPPPIGLQLHSATPQPQQQQQYPLQQPPYSPQLHALHQQPYSPPPQQQYLSSSQSHQYHPQQVPHTQVSHPPQVPQLYQQYNHPGIPPSTPAPIPQQQTLYTQTSQQPQQQHFAVPTPQQAVQSQTYTPQQPQQSQLHFSVPPPPPPPPPALQYNQADRGHSTPNPVAQPPPTPAPPSMSSPAPISPATPLPRSVDPVGPLSQSPTTTTTSPQVVPNIASVTDTEEVVRQRQEQHEAQPVFVAGSDDLAKAQAVAKESEQFAGERQQEVKEVKNTEEQGAREESNLRQQTEEEARQRREEGLQRQEDEERLKEQEVERKRLEEEEKRREEEERRLEEEELKSREEEKRREIEEIERRRRDEEERRKLEEERRRQEEYRRQEERRRQEEERKRREEEERRRKEEERIRQEHEEAERRRQAAEEEARRKRAEEAEAERRWQEELARIRARAEQEAADAAFARAQMEAEEEERRKQEEADLALVRRAQEEAEREERLARERRWQEEADMEVARREQAHEEELERRRQEGRRKRIEETDRELARKLDMELNLGAESSSNSGDQSRQRPRAERSRRH
ncbi:hypothetical protein JVU11DRAFT_4377 [Chiua virens]|nr:hypothetical protein JVU11DRAFT_4377 [Chiua virens]